VGRFTRRELLAVVAFAVAAVVIAIVSVTVAVSAAVGMIALLVAALFAAVVDLRHRLDVRHRQTARALRSLETLIRKDAAARDKAAPDQLRQIEALVQMYTALGGESLTPLSGRWAMDPIGLMALVHHVEQHQPVLVLELGGGTSTVWLQRALSRHGDGRLVSVDHDARFLEVTRDWLAREPGSGVAQVRHAPLEAMEVSGRLTSWYQPSVFDDLTGIDMLIVDGPPQSVGPWARFPALPLLVDRLADQAWIVLDDAGRPDERRIVEAWLEEIPGLSVVSADGLGGRHTVLRFDRREA
jgi:predicted O-methyltransferase YrrM